MDTLPLFEGPSQAGRPAAYPPPDPGGRPFVIARTDPRGGPVGEHYLGMEFSTPEAARAWIDSAADVERVALMLGGFRVRQVKGGRR